MDLEKSWRAADLSAVKEQRAINRHPSLVFYQLFKGIFSLSRCLLSVSLGRDLLSILYPASHSNTTIRTLFSPLVYTHARSLFLSLVQSKYIYIYTCRCRDETPRSSSCPIDIVGSPTSWPFRSPPPSPLPPSSTLFHVIEGR